MIQVLLNFKTTKRNEKPIWHEIASIAALHPF